MPRVLGRMIRLSHRFSDHGEGAAVISRKHIGRYANGADASVAANGDEHDNWLIEKSDLAAAHKAFAKALATGKISWHRARPHYRDVVIGKHERLFTADPQGNVVAHHVHDDFPSWEQHTPAHETHYDEQAFAGAPAWFFDEDHNPMSYGTMTRRRAQVNGEAAHKRAVAAGNVHSVYKIDPHHDAMVRGAVAAEAKGDQGARHVFADYLMDQGHPSEASLRDETTAESEPHRANIVGRLAQTEGQPHRFAHMTGFRPRRHEYTPKPRATDLREGEWAKIRHYFPEPDQGPRNRKTPVKVLLNATLFRLENNIPLRQLEEIAPDEPPWGSIHSFEYRVAESGLWPTIIEEIGRSHLLERLPKLIHGVAKVESPDISAKVNVEGLPVSST